MTRRFLGLRGRRISSLVGVCAVFVWAPPLWADSGADPLAGSPTLAARKNWISVALQQDFLFLPSAANPCVSGAGYDCFRDDESPFYSALSMRSATKIDGGLGAATTRVLVGYERAFYNFTAGVRLGFALGGGPEAPGGQAFLPAHVEGRLAYWFGSDPFARGGLRPYLAVFGGLGQVDCNVPIDVYTSEVDAQAGRTTTLDAWKKAGTGFAGLGAGLLYALAPRTGPYAEMRGMQLFGASGTAMSLQLGYSFGF